MDTDTDRRTDFSSSLPFSPAISRESFQIHFIHSQILRERYRFTLLVLKLIVCRIALEHNNRNREYKIKCHQVNHINTNWNKHI